MNAELQTVTVYRTSGAITLYRADEALPLEGFASGTKLAVSPIFC